MATVDLDEAELDAVLELDWHPPDQETAAALSSGRLRLMRARDRVRGDREAAEQMAREGRRRADELERARMIGSGQPD